MTDQTKPTNAAQKNAQKFFAQTEPQGDKGEALAKQARKKERASNAAKTAKLRGLRLAKEEADKQAAEQAGSLAGAVPKRSKRAPAVKPPAMKRLTY